jgi:HEAT repeat protein
MNPTEPREPETKCHGPQALAERADDGFLLVIRSTGKTVGGLSSGAVKGIAKVGQVLTARRRKTVQQQPKPSDAAPPRQLDEETEPAASQDPQPLPNLQALLEGRSLQDVEQAAVLRRCLDDLLLGSEEAGEGALKILVGLGQIAEPLLVACLPTDSPRVAKIALEGLSRIDSQRLIGCISAVLESSDPELRSVALRAAVGLGDERQRQLMLERGLRDPDANVRRRALSYVGWHNSYWAIAEAMRLCNDKTPEVQWAAVETLMAQRPSETNSILQLVKPSLDLGNQRRAAVLLGQQEDQGTLPEKNENRMRDASKAG